MSENLVSFKLDNFAASGLVPDGTYKIVSNKFVLWDYNGKIAGNVCALKVEYQPVTISGSTVKEGGSIVDQHYSVGDASAFGPSQSGTGLVAVGNRAQLSGSCNFKIFLDHFVNSGFAESEFENDVSVFDGYVVSIQNIPEPTRANLQKSNLVQGAQPQQEKQNRTIPVVSDILLSPDQVGKVGAKVAAPAKKAGPVAVAPAKKTAAPAPAAAEPTGDDPTELLMEKLGTLLNGGPMERVQLRMSLFKSLNGVDVTVRNATVALFNNETVLSDVLTMSGYKIEGTQVVPA